VPPEYRGAYHAGRIKRMKYACSGFLLYLGVDRTYDHVQHQSIYFSEGYKANLDAIFKTKTIPDEPSFHMSIPTVTDPNLAPDGHSLIYLLAPVPNTTAQIDWERAGGQVREKLLGVLEKVIDPAIRRHIVWERQYTPDDFASDFNAVHGTAFGSLAQGFFQSSYFRPPNKASSLGGLYFVGQGTTPGIGIPMVHISARLVAERIAGEWL
jgi:phytoene desaturase